MDLTKIYEGPITALGIAAAGTVNSGSYTDLGALLEESGCIITWDPFNTGLSDGNKFMNNGLGKFIARLAQTNPTGIQASLETYRTALAKLKITTLSSSEFYYIDNVCLSFKRSQDFKPGGVFYIEVSCERVTDMPDDFCAGPTTATP